MAVVEEVRVRKVLDDFDVVGEEVGCARQWTCDTTEILRSDPIGSASHSSCHEIASAIELIGFSSAPSCFYACRTTPVAFARSLHGDCLRPETSTILYVQKTEEEA